ncbi:MAG: GntR family transcriptional regulator [Pseudomonadota bacterium]
MRDEVAMNMSRVAAPQLRELVYDQLMRALMVGEFKPGDSFTITALAEQVGTSIVPVREAMQRLSAEGAIELLPGKSARVPQLTPDAFDELMMVRLMLEGKAASLAAKAATPELIAAIRLQYDRMSDAIERHDVAAMMIENKRFHFEIYRGAGAPTLERLIEILWLRVGPYLASSFSDLETGVSRYSASNDRHRQIVEAFEAGDPKAAKRAVQNDLRDFAEGFRKVYPDMSTSAPA